MFEIDDIDMYICKERVLALLFKPKLPQAASSFMQAHMIEGTETTTETKIIQTEQNQIYFMKHLAKL